MVSGRSFGVHDADAALLGQLGTIVDVVDPVPADVIAAAKALFALRDVDAELMQVVDTDGLQSAVRGPSARRMHFFELGDVAVDVELTIGDPFAEVLGAVVLTSGEPVPPGWSMVLETTSASYSTPVEPDGRFTLARVPLGLVRFRMERGSDAPLTTPWVDAR
ncbi:MAG: carboxypeptidase regulatory-like domain-containing protein [Actinomycetota bacterium]|nr:carboxypeptidase regulatory-like domain-containing protein [Actinomycetota bacterium]